VVCAGCSNKPTPPAGTGLAVGAPAAPKAADLTRTVAPYGWQSSPDKEPLSFAKMVAKAAGGTWIAMAPHPLEELKWKPNERAYQPIAITELFDQVQKAGDPLVWESRPGYTLLYFGPKADLDRMRERPPQEIVGLLLVSDSATGMIRAASDFWKLKIDAEPSLLSMRETLLKARMPQEGEEETPESASARYAAMMGTTAGGPPTLELKLAEHSTPEELMEKMAGYLGGEAQDAGGGKWRFAKISKPDKVREQLETLQKVVEERSASAAAGFTSYAGRSGGSTDAAEEVETDVDTPLQPIDDEAQDALDRLAMLGSPALDTLRDFLKPENPSLTRSALQALSALRTPDSSSAIVNFVRDLPTRTANNRAARRPLAVEAIRAMKRNPQAEFTAVLNEMAKSPEYTPETRLKARLALAETGQVGALLMAGADEPPAGEMTFNLVVPPDPKPVTPTPDGPPGSIPPNALPETVVKPPTPTGAPDKPKRDRPPDAVNVIATYAAPGGDTWGMYLSGRLGDPDDIWLARQASGQWTDFVFTGKQYVRTQGGRGYYGAQNAPKKGSCKLKVDGDKATISPADPKAAKELEIIQKKMNDPKLKAEDRTKLNKRYYELYEKTTNALKAPISVSFADIRKDGDSDGLTDLVEERFGTDPTKPDSDGDGQLDGKDPSPMAAPVKSPNDRQTLLAAIFTTLCMGDPSVDPIVVVLDRDQWQQMHGPSGRVIFCTKEEYGQRVKHLGTLRTLQFGGPKDGASTILLKDGPCLFNDSKTKAEVHFWMMRPSQAAMYGYRGSGSGQTQDYTARFEKDGKGWALKSVKPWKYDTAEKSAQELSQRMSSEGVY
jgi:hypothetical protein